MEALITKHEARKKSRFGFRISDFGFPRQRGYTLIELIVAVGLFSLVMMLASGAYFIMINLNRQVQGATTGINNLSFVLETMTRSIRTGADYNCGGLGDCQNGSSNFAFKDTNNVPVSYDLVESSIRETRNGVTSVITDPSIDITSLIFYTIGTIGMAAGDYQQPHVTIIVSGTVTYGAGKTEPFSVQTGATMRGPDISGSSDIAPPPPPPSGSCGVGGILTEAGGDCIHKFIVNGTFTLPNSVNSVEALVVGGGGGGGGSIASAGGGGGGGAGGYKYNASFTVTSGTSYSVIVGDGGNGGISGGRGSNGRNSMFSSSIIAIGGGGGATPGGTAGSGGSGGGEGGGAGGSFGTGIDGQGNNGGTSGAGDDQSGSGGGAGAPGTMSGAGGIGIQSEISGAATYYAGGGGGGKRSDNGYIGGLGGGGQGGTVASNYVGMNAVANTGGGGGGGSKPIGGSRAGGSGGSGIVIIRYAKP